MSRQSKHTGIVEISQIDGIYEINVEIPFLSEIAVHHAYDSLHQKRNLRTVLKVVGIKNYSLFAEIESKDPKKLQLYFNAFMDFMIQFVKSRSIMQPVPRRE